MATDRSQYSLLSSLTKDCLRNYRDTWVDTHTYQCDIEHTLGKCWQKAEEFIVDTLLASAMIWADRMWNLSQTDLFIAISYNLDTHSQHFEGQWVGYSKFISWFYIDRFIVAQYSCGPIVSPPTLSKDGNLCWEHRSKEKCWRTSENIRNTVSLKIFSSFSQFLLLALLCHRLPKTTSFARGEWKQPWILEDLSRKELWLVKVMREKQFWLL